MQYSLCLRPYTMTKLLPLILLPALLILNGCSAPQSKMTTPKPVKTAQTVTYATGDNSQNSLDWPGEYTGVIPCASCEGIDIHLILHADFSYQLTQGYLGKQDTPTVQEGVFIWNNRGSAITLDNSSTPMQFQVGENQLFMLNQNGEPITGALAQHYRLQKH
ncbi:copper resistance protein [Shewanella colwelliana]|uniref:Copper resistance protein n=2 Tax=Shewanella colwelliana TaxID=23 RepID=A0ABQ4NYQ7_SHECO|nr:copper resistance protein [Shewanella colwelliana]